MWVRRGCILADKSEEADLDTSLRTETSKLKWTPNKSRTWTLFLSEAKITVGSLRGAMIQRCGLPELCRDNASD
jgi:hypothetical protein